MKEVQRIKGLKSQLSVLVGEAEALKNEIGHRQREYNQKAQAIKHLKTEISKLENTNSPRVSEHAVLRYLERVKGINIEDIEKEILSDKIVDWATQLGGNGSYPNGEFQVVMKNFTVTTVV